MSGLCGIVVESAAVDGDASLERMLAALAAFPHADVFRAASGRAFLGRVSRRAAVERGERTGAWREGEWTFVAEARLDEPSEAARRLGGAPGRSRDDGWLVAEAFRRGDDALLGSLFGDWVLAGWDAGSETLALAREPNGCAALYYVELPGAFAFASTLGPLLALEDCPTGLDEHAVARSMTRFDGHAENTTVFTAIRYLPPGQILRRQGGRTARRRYWKLEEAFEPLSLGYADAADELRRHVRRAVERRVLPGCRTGATLSSGLDSTGVAALASAVLGGRGESLDAYCAVPLHPTACVAPPGRYVDEGPVAAAFAAALGNVRYMPIDAAAITPLEGIERTVDHLCRPAYATSNDHWLHALYSRASEEGDSVVLNGGFGNVTMSYGILRTQSAASLAVAGRFRAALARVRHRGAYGVRRHRAARGEVAPWGDYSCIARAFAERIGLAERMREHGRDPGASAARFPSGRDERLSWFDPLHGANMFQDMLARRYGLDILDPSTDTELVLFTLALPERVFTGPRQEPRWLYREAMRGTLPESIRTGTARGYQAADLNARLRADAERMTDLLERLARHPFAREAIDLPRLQRAWERVRKEDTIDAHRDAWTLLLNGAATGLFLLRHG